jgi:hypothetical protein
MTTEDKGQRTTTDVALERLSTIGPSAAERARNAEIQRGIDATMREVIREAKYNPNALDAPINKVVPQGAVPAHTPGERWVDPRPLATPEDRTTDEHIRRLADHFGPHGSQSPLSHGMRSIDANLKAAEESLAKEEEPTK